MVAIIKASIVTQNMEYFLSARLAKISDEETPNRYGPRVLENKYFNLFLGAYKLCKLWEEQLMVCIKSIYSLSFTSPDLFFSLFIHFSW